MEMTSPQIRSGTPSAHLVVASFFTGFGIFFLLVDLKRARELGAGESFCKQYVPEKNPAILYNVGRVMLFACTVGFLMEGIGGVLDWHHSFFLQALHETVYVAFGFLGFVCILESKKKLPVDSGRAAMVLALSLFYLMMSAHSKMKKGSTDGALHNMLANLCLVHASIYAYSVVNPRSLVAFFMSHALLMMEGVWLTTVAYFEAGFDIPMHLVEAIFSFELLVVLTTIIVIAIHAVPAMEDSALLPVSHDCCQRRGLEYSKLVVASGADSTASTDSEAGDHEGDWN